MQVAQGSQQTEPSSSAARDAHRLRNGLIWTVALAVLLITIGLAVPGLRGVLDRLTHAKVGWVVLGVGLEVASCLGYVILVRLVLRRAPAREVRRLAWAEMAFGAVVPVGGAGGLAVGAWALRAWGVSWRRIANRSAVIFLLTSAVNTAVLGLAAFGLLVGLGEGRDAGWLAIVPTLVSIVALTFFLSLPLWIDRGEKASGEGRVNKALRGLASWVRATEGVAFKPNWRLLGAPAYLLFDITVLWCCLRAFGSHPSVLAVVVGYQVGYLANLLPIPGGIGVLEGGPLGALLLYGLPAAPTATAVIVYHAIALWVPALGGTIGFARLRGAVAAGTRQLRLAPELGDQSEARGRLAA
jgi:uncharacterized membrane protein YbhN (UPF0104 family)